MNVRAAQLNPAQSKKCIYPPPLIFYYLSLFLFISTSLFLSLRTVVGKAVVSSICDLIDPKSQKLENSLSQQCEHIDLIVFMASGSVLTVVQLVLGVCSLVCAHVPVYVLLHNCLI